MVRDGLTGFLQVAAEVLRLYDPVEPIVLDLVRRHGTSRIVDLGSGGAGPVVRLVRRLREVHDVDVEAVLTDRYPNVGAFAVAEARGQGRIRAVREPVDVADVPADLVGVRTMFNALHHFRPELVRRMVADAACKRQPFCAVEIVERRPSTVGFIAAAPLATVVLAPLQRPFLPSRAALTFALPVIPGAVLWDGMMSCLRAYSVDELLALTAGLADAAYRFRVQQLEIPWTPLRITALIGERIEPGAGSSVG